MARQADKQPNGQAGSQASGKLANVPASARRAASCRTRKQVARRAASCPTRKRAASRAGASSSQAIGRQGGQTAGREDVRVYSWAYGLGGDGLGRTAQSGARLEGRQPQAGANSGADIAGRMV